MNLDFFNPILYMWINHKDRSNSTVLVGFFNISIGVLS
nr:MAG TPA: hypothetical protein [Caudoviricetes sp.]